MFKKNYLVNLCPIFDGSASNCLTMYQKILWGGVLGCKNILNFPCFTMKFHNRHDATLYSTCLQLISNEYDSGAFRSVSNLVVRLYKMKKKHANYISWAILKTYISTKFDFPTFNRKILANLKSLDHFQLLWAFLWFSFLPWNHQTNT